MKIIDKTFVQFNMLVITAFASLITWAFHACIMLIQVLYHTIYLAEPESKEPTELSLVKETNPELDQGKPRCISLKFLDFCFSSLLDVKYDCALSCRRWLRP
jgi:hypothetical protein